MRSLLTIHSLELRTDLSLASGCVALDARVKPDARVTPDARVAPDARVTPDAHAQRGLQFFRTVRSETGAAAVGGSRSPPACAGRSRD